MTLGALCRSGIRPIRQPYPRPIERKLPRGKAVTIGIGFNCVNGIVLCSDTQITWQGSHKAYRRKIYTHRGDAWTAAFSFAGLADVMESFDEKFDSAMSDIRPPCTVEKIQQGLEGVLLRMDVLDNEGVNRLHMVGGIAVPGDRWKLIGTDQKIVRKIDDYGYVGCGDTSLLRFLGPMFCESSDYTVRQATMLGVYLIMKARTHVDGCGGDTEGIVIRPSGAIEEITPTAIYRAEQGMLKLEKYVKRTASALFDKRVSDEDFSKLLNALTGNLKEEHFQMGIGID